MAVRINNNQYSQNQISSCLKSLSLLTLRMERLLSCRQCPGYSGQLVCQSTGHDKSTFSAQQLPDPVGPACQTDVQVLYKNSGTLNQQGSDFFVALLADPQQRRPAARDVLTWYQSCCCRKITAAGVLSAFTKLSGNGTGCQCFHRGDRQ